MGDDIRKDPRFDNLLERIGHPMMVGVCEREKISGESDEAPQHFFVIAGGRLWLAGLVCLDFAAHVYEPQPKSNKHFGA